MPERLRTHDLKVWPPYFDALADGTKTFEVRKDDRGIEPGDLLQLREWDPTDSGVPRVYEPVGYTGREVTLRVSYVLRGREARDFGISRDHCVIALSAASAPVGGRSQDEQVRRAESDADLMSLFCQGADEQTATHETYCVPFLALLRADVRGRDAGSRPWVGVDEQIRNLHARDATPPAAPERATLPADLLARLASEFTAEAEATDGEWRAAMLHAARRVRTLAAGETP
jgi:uncharacterized protein DUF3850